MDHILQRTTATGTRRYFVSSVMYGQLLADGRDPATISDKELIPHADRVSDYDLNQRLSIEVVLIGSETVSFEYPEQAGDDFA